MKSFQYYNSYSVRNAVTGSLFAAFLEGIIPPMSVNSTLIRINIIAYPTGSTALISLVPARWWIIALPGINIKRERPIPIKPAVRPIIKV